MAVTGRSPSYCPADVLRGQSCTKLARVVGAPPGCARYASQPAKAISRGGADQRGQAVSGNWRAPGIGDGFNQSHSIFFGIGRTLTKSDVVDIHAGLKCLPSEAEVDGAP